MTQKITQEGIDLIKEFEGLAKTAFRDDSGAWTIGYGHKGGVEKDASITDEEAELLLLEELHNIESSVSALVKVPLNENEFSALTSLVFNIGPEAFASSGLLKKLNRDDRLGAADGFDWWVDIDMDGQRIQSKGLKRRRAAEKALFLTPSHVDPAIPGNRSSTRARPLGESSPRRKSFWASRSIKVSFLALFMTSLLALFHLSQGVDPALINDAGLRQALLAVLGLKPIAFKAAVLIVLVSLIYLIFIRFDDWRHYRR
ncbi:MAG: hypothetical protein EP340_05395 [Alphaproteobacteria bacterium]|nr:MAG: hypothetical protein EP340_05395 [Alphaproteobacteria bacterium]